MTVCHLNAADYADFRRLETDAEVKQFTGRASELSAEAYQRFISKPSATCMAECAKDDRTFIGRCGFRKVDDRIELEIFLFPRKQGQGLGAELFDAMISHCATAFPTAKIGGLYHPRIPER